MVDEKQEMRNLTIRVETNLSVLKNINDAQLSAIVELTERFKPMKVVLHRGGAAFLPNSWVAGHFISIEGECMYDFGVDPQGAISS